jgi:biotin carboxyl carrier protein
MRSKDNFKFLNINSTLYKTRFGKKFEHRKKYHPSDPNVLTSFIPGTILDILVQEGQHVMRGEEVLILDAMKMQNRLKSSVNGIVKTIHVGRGEKVSKGSLLIEFKDPAL